MPEHYILIVDDEPHMRRVLEIMLHQAGHQVHVAGNGLEALKILRTHAIDLVITDMRMPEMDGLELLVRMREDGMETPVIIITAHGSVESAVEAMKQGASDYLLRPFDIDALELVIARVLNTKEVARQNSFMREELNRGWDAFVGSSPAMQAVYELIRQVAPTKTSVMISGETGTGKELAARAIHNASPRHGKLFVPINCAAIPAEMLEAELFGHEKGAFTGAAKERIGKFELANEGTLFLDEITEMPMALQAKLLRVLQENTLERLGSNRSIPLDIRLIAATNRDPREAIRDNRLREDLYYRINVFSINLPPLRERKEDIAHLAMHFITKHGHRTQGVELGAGIVERLQAYDWPGNVRELENITERALVLSGNGPLKPAHFPLDPTPKTATPAPGPDSPTPIGPMAPVVEALEARMIFDALAQTGGSKPKAAALLDISERTLWYKLKKYKL
ncbi:sigma-54-dependent transcriptional regulator [Uliginosibacterium gangwonense]|uniref:sigma-54-dependent transcriptional regulator n=1 Tax=Uliginosibacterium gangwonense TaxID=392736 RepID=UPI0003768EBF|nr:sigma-54 dependent transcriptional regulator [Uliginosibacterium gangwonense]